MKKFLFLSIFISCSICQAQKYSVIHVSGKIFLPDEGTYLDRGMKVDAESKLKFEDEEAKAAVLSSEMGRFILQKNGDDESNSDLLYVLSSVVTPARGKMSTRSGVINNYLDFQKRFGQPIAWIGPTFSVPVSPDAYPFNDSVFFFARYKLKQEVVNKKINTEEGQLIFNKTDYFSVDGQPVDPFATSTHQLYYYDATKQESTFITDLDLRPVNDEEILDMAEELDEMSIEKKSSIIHEMISSMYGACDLSVIDNILKKQ